MASAGIRQLALQLLVVELDRRNPELTRGQQELDAGHPTGFGGLPRGHAAKLEQLGEEQQLRLLGKGLGGLAGTHQDVLRYFDRDGAHDTHSVAPS